MEGAYLRITRGAREGMHVPLLPSKVVVIGRKRGELLLDDPLVSSAHCQVVLRDGEVLLEDLGSTNGTRVDGRRVREVVLRDGSEIVIGGSTLVLHLGIEDAPSDAASSRPSPSQIGIAWLLDGEQTGTGASEKGRPAADLIGQDLRLPPGLNAVVEIVAGLDAGKVFRFNRGNVSIGRRQGEVPLSDVEVSRNHAVIEVFGRDMIFLRDLGSTNGTYHNGRRVSVSRLKSGDTIGVGRSVLKLQITR